MKQSRYFKTMDECSAFAAGLSQANTGHIHSIDGTVDWLYPEPVQPFVVTWIDENKRETQLSQEPEPMTPQEYVREHKGTKCPVCRSENIEGDRMTIRKGHAYQYIYCSECNAKWTDCYELSGYDDLKR